MMLRAGKNKLNWILMGVCTLGSAQFFGGCMGNTTKKRVPIATSTQEQTDDAEASDDDETGVVNQNGLGTAGGNPVSTGGDGTKPVTPILPGGVTPGRTNATATRTSAATVTTTATSTLTNTNTTTTTNTLNNTMTNTINNTNTNTINNTNTNTINNTNTNTMNNTNTNVIVPKTIPPRGPGVKVPIGAEDNSEAYCADNHVAIGVEMEFDPGDVQPLSLICADLKLSVRFVVKSQLSDIEIDIPGETTLVSDPAGEFVLGLRKRSNTERDEYLDRMFFKPIAGLPSIKSPPVSPNVTVSGTASTTKEFVCADGSVLIGVKFVKTENDQHLGAIVCGALDPESLP